MRLVRLVPPRLRSAGQTLRTGCAGIAFGSLRTGNAGIAFGSLRPGCAGIAFGSLRPAAPVSPLAPADLRGLPDLTRACGTGRALHIVTAALALPFPGRYHSCRRHAMRFESMARYRARELGKCLKICRASNT